MKDKMIDTDTLSEYLNKSSFTTTDDEIAMYIYEHRNEIKEKSLKELASDSYISQPSFTRFFKKHGVEKYQNFRFSMAEFNARMDHYIKFLKESVQDDTLDEVKQKIVRKQVENIDMIFQLDHAKLLEMLEILCSYRRVIFVGSDLSMAMLRSFQGAMIYYGVNCYTLSDPRGQEYMIEHAQKGDLVICVSIKGRWFNSSYSKTTIDQLFKSECFKMLWTIDPWHKHANNFDYIYYFGKPVNEFGYTQLSNFVFLLNYVYIEHQDKKAIY